MRLMDLNPEWRNVDYRNGGGAVRALRFQCPSGRGHSILIPVSGPKAHWQISGEDFNTLTITPSINEEGCWHGFITNGNVT
jgi:hypothetical protein